MKLPFDFGLKFVLRLLLPGAIMAMALLPIGRSLRSVVYPELGDPLTLLVLGLLAGFMLLLLDMPIYMLLEGRRYWPGRLRRAGIRRQAERLARLKRLADTSPDPRVQVEYQVQVAEFPTDKASGEAQALYPTRLGNLLASYETYPSVKYGLDGVFFWPRLWVAIDKDLREELDSAQAVVDGAVYTCAALAAAAVLALAYAAILGPAWPWMAAAVAGSLLSYGCYRAALPRYAQYGALFAATFDQHRDKLSVTSILADLDTHMNDVRVPPRSEREAGRAAWRFLKWHRYRRSSSTRNEVVKDWLS